jgi:hypothetical protein
MTSQHQPSPVTIPAARTTGAGRLSGELERWLAGDGEKTLGGLIHTFGDKSFAILLVVLLGIPALPIPTGGATHVFEIIAVIIAVQLIAGRHEVWLPQRWRRIELAGAALTPEAELPVSPPLQRHRVRRVGADRHDRRVPRTTLQRLGHSAGAWGGTAVAERAA